MNSSYTKRLVLFVKKFTNLSYTDPFRLLIAITAFSTLYIAILLMAGMDQFAYKLLYAD